MRTQSEQENESKDRDLLKPGMKVHGILALQRGPMNRNVKSIRHGVITKIEEKRFWVQYKGILCELPYMYKNLGHIVFIEENACEEKLAEIESPQLEEGFFRDVPKGNKKEKEKDT